jgi:hypothetical protein
MISSTDDSFLTAFGGPITRFEVQNAEFGVLLLLL